jgi:hypothetical protein
MSSRFKVIRIKGFWDAYPEVRDQKSEVRMKTMPGCVSVSL